MTLTALRRQLAEAVATCPAANLSELAGILEAAKVAVLARVVSPVPQTADVVDVATLAEELGIAESWLRAQARGNRLPHIRAGKHIRFRRSEVLSALERGRVDHRMGSPVAPEKRSNGAAPVSECFQKGVA